MSIQRPTTSVTKCLHFILEADANFFVGVLKYSVINTGLRSRTKVMDLSDYFVRLMGFFSRLIAVCLISALSMSSAFRANASSYLVVPFAAALRLISLMVQARNLLSSIGVIEVIFNQTFILTTLRRNEFGDSPISTPLFHLG